MSDFPFKQKRLNKNTLVRSFSKNLDSEELVWHRDKDDRFVEVVSGKGWSIQLDNQMPEPLSEGQQVFIPAKKYHRLIKGNDDLLIKILEKKDQNKDGKNDFEDVKIARMKASGMSSAEIEDKHPELFEDDSPHPAGYGAPQGSKRDKKLDKTKEDLEKAKKLRKDGKTKQAKELEQRAYKRRERMEKKERNKKGFKNKPRKDTKKESVRMTESQIRKMIREALIEGLSKKTKATLKKKAEKRGLTPGSVYKEFEKGLAAWASSGSRKGMSQHQWAHARVNSATPSKSWAVVKKSKAKKKKKK